MVLSWVEAVEGGHVLRHSDYRDGAWTTPVDVGRGANWFVNWIDIPSVVPLDREFRLAHWLVTREGGGPMDYDISLVHSRDGGRSWSAPIRPYASTVPAQYGFVSIFPEGPGAGLVWLDGRDYVPEKSSGTFALRHARVHRDGRVAADGIVDGDVCSCCQTAVAESSAGPVVAYRGHDGDEIRDNELALARNGGWQRGAALGTERWTIAACPTNGPAISAQGDHVAAAWFTGADGRARVRAAFSTDGGRTLGSIVDLDDRDPVGRLGLEQLDARTAVVAWIGEDDGRRPDAPLYLRTVRSDGALGTLHRVDRIATSRDSGIVQVALDGDRVVLAWALPRPRFGIRVVSVRVDDLGRP